MIDRRFEPIFKAALDKAEPIIMNAFGTNPYEQILTLKFALDFIYEKHPKEAVECEELWTEFLKTKRRNSN